MTTLINNKRATFNYEILESFEAGIVLSGHEAKAIRVGKATLQGAYVIIRGGEAYLVGASISPYQVANTPTKYDPEQPRKLLLSKKELAVLEEKGEQAGLTIVPIRLYNTRGKIKLEVALVRGKKVLDKRETIKKRETKRAIERILKSQN